MNAPANIKAGPEIRLDETAAERAHRASISIHLPNEGETNMHLRAQIAEVRDQAMAGQSRARSEAVADILHAVAIEAMAAVYAPMPAKRLFLLRCALVGMIDAARQLERAGRDG